MSDRRKRRWNEVVFDFYAVEKNSNRQGEKGRGNLAVVNKGRGRRNSKLEAEQGQPKWGRSRVTKKKKICGDCGRGVRVEETLRKPN